MSEEVELVIDNSDTKEGSCEKPSDYVAPKIGNWVMLASFISNCSGGVFPTLQQPFMQAGVIGGFIVTIVVGLASMWSCWFIIKYIIPNRKKMLDDIITDRFPRIGFAISIVSKLVSSLLYLTYGVGNFMFLNQALSDLIYNRHHNLSLKIQMVITSCIVFLLTMIRTPAFTVLLSAISVVTPIFTVSGITWYGFRYSNSVDRQCMKEAFTSISGEFHNSTHAGWGAMFSLGGVLLSSYYMQSGLPSMLSPAKHPRNNQLICQVGFAIVIVIYLWISIVGSLPYACGWKEGIYPPSNYQTNFTQGGFALTEQSFFLIAQVLGPPYTFMIFRATTIDWLPWHRWPKQSKRWADYFTNACLIVIGACITYYGTSIQTILEIGGVGCTIVWAVIIPLGWDMYVERRGHYIKHTISALIGALLVSISIGQYCF